MNITQRSSGRNLNHAGYRPYRIQAILTWLIFLILLVATPKVINAEAIHTRIINGSASTRSWPWMVSLAFAQDDLARGHFCGGTLIDPRFVLTSAHCVIDFVGTPEVIRIVIGRTNLTEPGGIVVPAAGILIAPSFSPYSLQNDFALIRLAFEVTGYQPLPLISPIEATQVVSGTQVVILGWGGTDPEVPIRPAILQEASVPIVSDAQCSDRLGIDFDPASMVCAGALSTSTTVIDGVDSCYGDSGGPMMVQRPEGWKLFGITSWGFACASDKYWGVYARETAYYESIGTALKNVLYPTSPPEIKGTPVVGKKLRCKLGTFHGKHDSLPQVKWLDLHSRRILSRQLRYQLRPSDIGRSLGCKITLSNSLGSASAESHQVGPVFAGRAGPEFQTKGSAIVRDAAVYCLGVKCSIIVSFRVPVKFVEGLIPRKSACGTRKCGSTLTWKSALSLSETEWRIPLDFRLKKPLTLRIQAIGRDSNSITTLELSRI